MQEATPYGNSPLAFPARLQENLVVGEVLLFFYDVRDARDLFIRINWDFKLELFFIEYCLTKKCLDINPILDFDVNRLDDITFFRLVLKFSVFLFLFFINLL